MVHLNSNEFYWCYKSHSGGDWGFSAVAEGEIYGLGDTDELCREILLAGGLEPLIGTLPPTPTPPHLTPFSIAMASGGPEPSRIIACRALCHFLKNEKIFRDMNQVVAESLIDLAVSRRYSVTHLNGVVLNVSSSSDVLLLPGTNLVIPHGTVLVISHEEAISSSKRKLHITSPVEYAGWIESSNSSNELVVRRVELDDQTLKLIGLLSLENKFREEFISRGKMRTLLKLLQVNDIFCHRAVAVALDEISGDIYQWAKAGSSFEIHFENVNGTPVLYSTEDLEHRSWSEYSCGLPSYSGDVEVGMIVEKTSDYRADSKSISTTGTVLSVRGNDVEVLWGSVDSPHPAEQEWVESGFVRVVRSNTKKILSYNSSSLTFLIDIESVIPADVILQLKSSSISPTILYEAYDHTRFLGQPGVSENNSLFIDFNCRTSEQLLRTHLVIYVAPRIDSSVVDALSYENDSFLALLQLMKSPDVPTKVASISALGKLASYLTDTGIISKSSTGYRNRVINDNSIFDIISSTADSTSSVVAAAACRALSRILPNMDSLIQLITRSYHSPSMGGGDEEISLDTMSFFAAWLYRLVYSRHRPFLNPKNYEPVVLTTQERSNNEEGYPFEAYANSSHHSSLELTTKFDHSIRMSMAFHPMSKINSATEEIKDVLIIHPSGTRIHQSDIAEAIENEKTFHFDRTESLVLDFHDEVSRHPQVIQESDRSAPGFSVIIVGEYPNFEEIVYLSSLLKETTGGGNGYQFFYMANEIDIIIPPSFHLPQGDILRFYQEDLHTNSKVMVSELIGPFDGPWRHSIRSDRLWYSLKSGGGGGHLMSSSYFHLVACFDQFGSDRVIRDNMRQLLPNSLKKRERSGGLHFLLQMLQSDEISVKRWAAMAYTQIASVMKPHDLYTARIMSHRMKEATQENDVRNPNQEELIPPVDILYRQGSGISEATAMAINSDPIIRRQGCLSFARFLHCKGAHISLVSDALKILLSVCKATYSSPKISDIDTCRHTTWIILQLSQQPENLEKMATYGVFESLITCLSSNDRLVKFFAAEALFSLANNATNRKQLVQTGLSFLVRTATTQVSMNYHDTTASAASSASAAMITSSALDEMKDALSLQQGAAKVLCKLVNPLDLGSIVHALDNLVDEAMRLLLLEADLLLKSSPDPEISQSFLDGIELVRYTLETIAQNLSEPQVRTRVMNRLLIFEDIFNHLESLFIHWSRNSNIASLLTPISYRLISMCYTFITTQNALNFIVMRTLMIIASTCWRIHGTNIFRKLKEEMKWMERFLKDSPLDFHKYCLTPALTVLNTTPVSEGSYVILDLLRESNILASCSSEEEQMILLNQLFFRIETPLFKSERTKRIETSQATGVTGGGGGAMTTTPVPGTMTSSLITSPATPAASVAAVRQHVTFRYDHTSTSSNNRLEICASTGLHGNVWLTIDIFYRYELRSNVRDYLDSTLRLWDWLILTKHSEACELFVKYLPFVDVYQCLLWPYLSHCINYKNYSRVFCDLMLHLYVCNINFEVTSMANYLHEKSLDEISTHLLRSPRNLLKFEKLDLILLMNDFLGAGRRLSAYPAKRPKDYYVTDTLITILEQSSSSSSGLGSAEGGGGGNYDSLHAASMLNLLKGMVLTGFYDDPSDFQYLQLILMKAVTTLQKQEGIVTLDSKKSRRNLMKNNHFSSSSLAAGAGGSSKSLKKKMKNISSSSSSNFNFPTCEILKIKIYEILLICLELDLLLQLRELDRLKSQLYQTCENISEMLHLMILENISVRNLNPQEGMRVSTTKRPSSDGSHRCGVIVLVTEDSFDVCWDDHYFNPMDYSEMNGGGGGGVMREQEESSSRRTTIPPPPMSSPTTFTRDSELYVIMYPRLQALLFSSHVVDRNIALNLPPSSSPEIIKLALKYYLNTHAASHRFFTSLQSVSLGNSFEEDTTFFHLLHQGLPFLKSVLLQDHDATDQAKRTNDRQQIKKILERIRYAIEGRTEGIIPVTNMFLCPGPDWRSDSKDTEILFRVVKVMKSDYDDGYQLTAAERGTSIEHTFLFGPKHCYELALPFPVGTIYRRRQRLAVVSKIFPLLLSLLQQEHDNTDDVTGGGGSGSNGGNSGNGGGGDSFLHSLHESALRLLTSWSLNCEENLKLIASAYSTYVLAEHLHHNSVRDLLLSAAPHEMFISVAPRLLFALTENIQHNVSDNMRNAISSLHILDKILPMDREVIDSSKHNDLLLTQTMLLQYLCNEVTSVIPFLQKLSHQGEGDGGGGVGEGSGEGENENDQLNMITEFQSPYTVLIVGLLAKGIQNNEKHKIKILNDFKSLSSETLPLVFMRLSRVCFGFKVRAKLLSPWINFMGELCEFNSLSSRILSDLHQTLLTDIKKYSIGGGGGREGSDEDVLVVESFHPYEPIPGVTIYRIDATNLVGAGGGGGVTGHEGQAFKVWFSQLSELEEHMASGEIDYVSIIPALPTDSTKLIYVKVISSEGLAVSKTGFLGGIQQTHLVIPLGTILTIRNHRWIESPAGPDGSGNYLGEILSPLEYSGIQILLYHSDVELCDESGRRMMKSFSPKAYTGTKFPLMNDELFLLVPPTGNEQFLIQFIRTGKFSKWGWKLMAKPCSMEEFRRRKGIISSSLFEESMHNPTTRVFESFSIHSNETYDAFHFVEFDEEVKALEIVFDDGTRLDPGTSFISFYKDQNRNEVCGEARYSGRRGACNWPGCEGHEPLHIPGSSFYYYCHTSPSFDFGYRFSVRAIPEIPEGFEKLSRLSSATTIRSQYFRPSPLSSSPSHHSRHAFNYDFVLAFPEPIYEVDATGEILTPLNYYLPSGTSFQIVEVMNIEEIICCRVDHKVPFRRIFIDPISEFNSELSHPSLEFSDNNTKVTRPPKVSVPFPACLSPITSEKYQVSFRIERMTTMAGFSIGVATSSFPKSRSRGFGASHHSWGFTVQRRKYSSDRETIKLLAMEQGIDLDLSLPAVTEGTRFTLQYNRSEGWVDIILLSTGGVVYRHRFRLPSTGTLDYLAGVTLAPQQSVVIEHEDTMTDFRGGELTPIKNLLSTMWIKASRLSFQVPVMEKYKISIPGKGLSIVADPGAEELEECLGPYGSVKISSREPEIPSLQFFSTETDPWPTIESPLLIPLSTIHITYHRYLPFAPGFRLVGVSQPVQKDPFQLFSRDPTKCRIIESHHPLNLTGEGYEQVQIPGAYGLFVIFDPRTSLLPSKNHLEFLDDQESGVVYRGGPDMDHKNFTGDNSNSKKSFPGCGDMPPLRISSDHFTLHYSLPVPDRMSWGWRMIVFDQSLYHYDLTDEELEVATGTQMGGAGGGGGANREIDDDEYFFFFENQTSLVQTIRIDMPLLVGQAYFEIYFGTSSTAQSYSQVGCMVSDPDNELHLEHNPGLPLTGTPSCLGVGSVIGSYAVGGVVDPTINTYRYCRGSQSNKPCEKMEFREGSIVGILMDIEEGKIFYYLDGVNMNKDPIFIRDLEISWIHRGGLCPVFSFCPGQLISINVGQSDFCDDEFIEKRLIQSFHPHATGLPQLWNTQSKCWEVVTHNSGVLVDLYCKEGQDYGMNVKKLVDRLREIYPLNKLGPLPDVTRNTNSYSQLPERVSNSFNIITQWEPYISDSFVEYSSDFKVAIQKRRSSITYAQLSGRQSMITFIVEDLDQNSKSGSKSIDLNAALVNLDYLNSSTKSPLGHASNTWGFYSSGAGIEKPVIISENGIELDSCRPLLIGDKISLVCDLDMGWMLFALNDGEFLRDLQLPPSLSYFVGVCVSRNCKVRILNEESRHLLAAVASLQRSKSSTHTSQELSDSRVISAFETLLSENCEERLSSLGFTYYHKAKAVAEKKEKEKEHLLLFNHVTTPTNAPKPVRWLRDNHSGQIPPSLHRSLQDLGIAEIFNHDDLMKWWERLIQIKSGKTPSATPHGKISKIYPETNLNIGSDPRVPFLAIVNAALQCDLSFANESFVLQVIKLLISLALSINPIKKTRNAPPSSHRKSSLEMTSDATFDDIEAEYLHPDAATTLLVIQSTLADLGVVRLLCHILAQVEIPLDLHREVLFLSNFMLLNAINQQESAEDWNVQQIFFDVMLGEGQESGKPPINVGKALGIRLEVLANEISAYRGSQQFGELYMTKQILIFLQRCCGMSSLPFPLFLPLYFHTFLILLLPQMDNIKELRIISVKCVQTMMRKPIVSPEL
jgi:hypothetical protein